jgi:hypothetical protein
VVTNVRPGPKTFTLTVMWTRTETVALADLNGLDAKLAFAVNVLKPVGNPFKLPRPGSVNLRGGAEKALATKAEAVLLASE